MIISTRRKFITRVAAAAIASVGLSASAIAATAYPTKPIRFIVCTAPGGATDVTTRLIAQKMSEKLGQQIIVENRAGADTMLGTLYVKEQPADGYTILAQSLNFSTLPYIKQNPGYSPTRDFTGIGTMTRVPFLMIVGGSEPVQTVQDYVARARKEPLSYGHGGVAGAPQMAAELFLRSYGLDVQAVPYKGNGAVMADVAAGRVSMFFDAFISSQAFLKSGKMRALAVAAPTRLPAMPNVPTFSELGLNLNYSVWLGLLAKTGTPPDIVQKLSEALQYAIENKELAERFRSEGSDPTFMTPKAFTEYLAQEYDGMAKLATELKFVKE